VIVVVSNNPPPDEPAETETVALSRSWPPGVSPTGELTGCPPLRSVTIAHPSLDDQSRVYVSLTVPVFSNV
jgi:hypothetical protein